MHKIEFETATLVDAVGKAARFAPTKGSALDKSGGIVFLFDKDPDVMKVLATDCDNSFVRSLTATEVMENEEGSIRWRTAHAPLVAVMNGLPVESGSRTILWSDDAEWMHIECGRVRAKLALYEPTVPYPDGFLDKFDMAADFADVENFAAKLSQIAWAVDPKSQILSGIHLTGTHAVATNQVCMARIPLDCPLDAPVTVTMEAALTLLREYPELALRATQDDLLVGVDEDTQVTCRLLKGKFPDGSKLLDGHIHDSIILERDVVLTSLARVSAPFSDKMPRCRVQIDAETLSLTMSSVEQGKIEDEIEHGQFGATRTDLWLTPSDFRDMLQGANENRVEFFYHGNPAGKPSLEPVKVMDRHGYVAITMPRKP